jgi:hypothetical protein
MARIRNRIRKADYYTDGELLRWHRDKRATYAGLWAIAEDSGCLEDDPFSWKMLIWGSPLDSDISVELLTQWRDELVEAGKLIPYEAEGKRYLFIRTFHQHEMPRNPQMNDLPLPEWVELVTTEGTGKDGKRWRRCRYIDHRFTVQNRYGPCTDTVETPLPCPALPRVPKGTQGAGGGKDGRAAGSLAPGTRSPAARSRKRRSSSGGPVCRICSGDIRADEPQVEVLSGRYHKDCVDALEPWQRYCLAWFDDGGWHKPSRSMSDEEEQTLRFAVEEGRLKRPDVLAGRHPEGSAA